MDLKEEDILGTAINTHWYYVSKGEAILSLLGNARFDEVIDVGAGSGVFSRRLLDNNTAETAVCVDPYYPEEKDEFYHGKLLRFVHEYSDCTPQLVLMMDVLEHVEDDLALLKKYTEGLASGSYVLVTVPAFRFLWSGHDLFLGHHRRYTLQQTEALLRAAGLDVVKGRYYFAALFPLIALLRWVSHFKLYAKSEEPKSDLRLLPSWLNHLLIAIHHVERWLLFPINRLAGLSVCCLARKI